MALPYLLQDPAPAPTPPAAAPPAAAPPAAAPAQTPAATPQGTPAGTPGTQQPGQNPQPQQSGGGDLISTLVMFGMIFMVFWFLVIRPQRKEQKRRMEMINNVRKNDRVLTSGGFYGVVLSIKENEVELKIDEKNNTRIRVVKSAIINVEQAKDEEESKEPAASNQ